MYKKVYIAPPKFAPPEPGGSVRFALLCFSPFVFPRLAVVFRPSRAQNNPKSGCLPQSIAYYMLTDSRNRTHNILSITKLQAYFFNKLRLF